MEAGVVFVCMLGICMQIVGSFIRFCTGRVLRVICS